MTELTEAEIERLCVVHERVGIAPLLDTVRDLIDARLAPIRALADEWAESTASGHPDCRHDEDCAGCAADDLRAALDAASAPVSAQQDHDPLDGIAEIGLTPGDAEVVRRLLVEAWDEGYTAAWKACHDQGDDINPYRPEETR